MLKMNGALICSSCGYTEVQKCSGCIISTREHKQVLQRAVAYGWTITSIDDKITKVYCPKCTLERNKKMAYSFESSDPTDLINALLDEIDSYKKVMETYKNIISQYEDLVQQFYTNCEDADIDIDEVCPDHGDCDEVILSLRQELTDNCEELNSLAEYSLTQLEESEFNTR